MKQIVGKFNASTLPCLGLWHHTFPNQRLQKQSDCLGSSVAAPKQWRLPASGCVLLPSETETIMANQIYAWTLQMGLWDTL